MARKKNAKAAAAVLEAIAEANGGKHPSAVLLIKLARALILGYTAEDRAHILSLADALDSDGDGVADAIDAAPNDPSAH